MSSQDICQFAYWCCSWCPDLEASFTSKAVNLMINANVDQYIAKPWTPKLKWRKRGLQINRLFHQSKQSSETLFAQILLKRARSNMPKVKVVKKHIQSFTDGDGHLRGYKLFFLPEFFVPGTAILILLRGRSSLAPHHRNIIRLFS